MAVAGNVRLVRCPKCENLLDLSVYQCGGCGAVLKAIKNVILDDGLQNISNAMKGIGIPESSKIPMESVGTNRGSQHLNSWYTPIESLRSRVDMDDQWGVKGKGTVSSCLQGNVDDCLYHDEGTSSYHGRNRIRHPDHDLENDRAGLLRKIDELRDQLNRSCDVSGKSNARRHHVLAGSHVRNRQQLTPEDIAARYISRSSEFNPYTMNRYRSNLRDSYAPSGYRQEFLRYPNTCQRTHHHPPYHEDVYNYCHQPSTCCDPSDFNRRSQNEPYILDYHHCLNSIRHGPKYSTLNPTDGVKNRHPRNIGVARKIWYPIAGGAPLVTCTNCFELLKPPRAHISVKKRKNKMKCGACHSLILFELPKKHVPTETDDGSEEADEKSSLSHILASGEHGFSSDELHSREVESELSPDDIVVNQFKSKRFEFGHSTSGQNSVQEEIEMDRVSQASVDKSNVDHSMVNKKGLKDLVKSNEEVGRVFVNEQLIPDSVVKKAEKVAGPIEGGEYWYDIRAGFWGVMGHPCLGIIMPNIEEFNYPLPEKCAAGNTGVLVNGRELHHKDLDLLVSRGLPNRRNGSYLIEISGKVVDEHTGEELDAIGKLAPTVERTKCGFGMKVPTFIAMK